MEMAPGDGAGDDSLYEMGWEALRSAATVQTDTASQIIGIVNNLDILNKALAKKPTVASKLKAILVLQGEAMKYIKDSTKIIADLVEAESRRKATPLRKRGSTSSSVRTPPETSSAKRTRREERRERNADQQEKEREEDERGEESAEEEAAEAAEEAEVAEEVVAPAACQGAIATTVAQAADEGMAAKSGCTPHWPSPTARVSRGA